MDKAGVPANSELRKYEHIFFLVDIWEIPSEFPPPLAFPLPSPEQPLIIQDSSLNVGVAIKTEKGKEVQPPTQASQSEDQFIINDMISKAKDAEEAGSKGNSKA